MTDKSIRQRAAVINQMLRGLQRGRLSVAVDEQTLRRFSEEHDVSVRWSLQNLPKDWSPAVNAVAIKFLIAVGPDPIERWCHALRTQTFRGANDPAAQFWKFLLRKPSSSKATFFDTYARALYCTRAYVEGEQITAVRTAVKEPFKWVGNYEVPEDLVPRYAAWKAHVALHDGLLTG